MRRLVFLFIESNTSGTGSQFVQVAFDMGYHPVVLSATPERYVGKLPSKVEVHNVDTEDSSSIRNWISKNLDSGVAGVYSSSDYFVGIAAHIAETLKLPAANSKAIEKCRQKFIQRSSLSIEGLNMPITTHVNSIDQIAEAYEKAGTKVVVKPQSGSGSYGVRFCETFDSTYDWSCKLLNSGKNERGSSFSGILIEEFLDGPEYSVEVFDGGPLIVAKKYLSEMPFFVEVGHDMPAPIGDDSERSLKEAAQAAVDALDLNWGPVHVEMRLTSKGPIIIEVNPRLAGGFLPKLVQLCTGIDLIKATICKASGIPFCLNKSVSNHAGIRFFKIDRKGTLLGIDRWNELRDIPCIVDTQLYAKVGDARDVNNDFRDRIGHVIAYGPSKSSVDQALDIAAHRPHFNWWLNYE